MAVLDLPSVVVSFVGQDGETLGVQAFFGFPGDVMECVSIVAVDHVCGHDQVVFVIYGCLEVVGNFDYLSLDE